MEALQFGRENEAKGLPLRERISVDLFIMSIVILVHFHFFNLLCIFIRILGGRRPGEDII